MEEEKCKNSDEKKLPCECVCVVGQKKKADARWLPSPPPKRSTVRFVSRHTELRVWVVSGCLDAPASPASTCTTFTPPLPPLFSAPTTRGGGAPRRVIVGRLDRRTEELKAQAAQALHSGTLPAGWQ